MHLLQQIGFAVLSLISIWLFAQKAGTIRRNILLGKDEALTAGAIFYYWHWVKKKCLKTRW